MDEGYLEDLRGRLAGLHEEGLYKAERVIVTAQGAVVGVAEPGGGPREVINLCANNYLGLAGDPELIEVARAALERHGYGMSSVRFICGTQAVHRELERRIAAFLGHQDAVLYSSCFDANAGLFEALLGPEDAVISDALNHASIIDGVRLCKARRLRYANRDLGELEARLEEARGCRYRLIATDGVFSMDGTTAPLAGICDLAERHRAMVMVDDSHAVGFMGAHGRGSPEHCAVEGRVEIVTGTLGKALGGASGGYVAARAEVCDWLRQRSRPYLFSNTLAPVIAATSIAVLERLAQRAELRERLWANTRWFRAALAGAGFELVPGEHPICPVMLGDPRLAQDFAARLLERGVYVTAFSYPVVPRGSDRIRTQMSAAHRRADLERVVEAFVAVGRELAVI